LLLFVRRGAVVRYYLFDAAADSDGGGWRGVKTKCNDGQKAKDWLVLVLAIDGNEMKMELLLQLPP
jgi:hypothetical protein